ncbi:MAG: trypsin-like peptidase domain-containing protein [Chloracidobacterium sp.]|nr:trypsin-like peptidase domain-containing protein [Chloracidobacterium sp.]
MNNDYTEHGSRQSMEELFDRYRRSSRRATLIAIAALCVALSSVAGLWLLRSPNPAKAGDGEVNPQFSSAFIEIARAVEPTVVNVSTVTQPAQPLRPQNELNIPRNSIERFDFGPAEPAQRGNGSGVIVDPQGYILTNYHVISGADRIKVKFYDGSEIPGKVIGSDSETDLAVVKVTPVAGIKSARFGNSDNMRVGDWVLAIGSPFGFDQTVTAGIISAKDRNSKEVRDRAGFQYFLQTDAAVNHGNSGGPLINLSGEVIGINTLIATSTGDYNGISFAIPSSEAISVYKQLVKQGQVIRGFLGAMPDRVTAQIAKIYGLPAPRGAIISNVEAMVTVNQVKVESPAAKAGLKPNDVIVEFRGEPVKDNEDLLRRVAWTPVGTTAPVKIYRDGRPMTLSVVIGRRPGREKIIVDTAGMNALGADLHKDNLGIGVENLNSQLALDTDLDGMKGVRIGRVEPGSVADDARLKANDVIETINREPVNDKEDFKRVLSKLKSGDPIVLLVHRKGLAPYPRIFISLNKP